MGVWRLNLDLLHEEGMQEKIKGLWAQQQEEYGKSGLEKLRKALADTCREFKKKGIQLAQERARQEKEAIQTLEALQILVESGGELTEELPQELYKAKFQLALVKNRKALTWQRRAKLKWAMEGDLPKKYFFARLKQWRYRNTIAPLPNQQGQLQRTRRNLASLITKHFRDFFAEKAPPSDFEAKWQRFAKLPRRVTEAQKVLLDKPLTEEELEEAMRALPTGKCPGRDGFP